MGEHIQSLGETLEQGGAGKFMDYLVGIHNLGVTPEEYRSGLTAISALLSNLVAPPELYKHELSIDKVCNLFGLARESPFTQSIYGCGYGMGLLNPEEAMVEINCFLASCRNAQRVNNLPGYNGFQRFGLYLAYANRMDIHMRIEAGVGLERDPTVTIFYPVKEDETQSTARVRNPTAKAMNAGNTLVETPYSEENAENDLLKALDLSKLMADAFFGEAGGSSMGLCKRFGLPLGDRAISVRITRSGTGSSFGGLELSILQELLAETDAQPDAYKILQNTIWGVNIPNGIIVNSKKKDGSSKDMEQMLATAIEEVIQLRISPIMIATYGDLGAFYIEEALVHALLCRVGLKNPEDPHSTPRNIPNHEILEKELEKFLYALELSDQVTNTGSKNNLFFEIAQITKAFREANPGFLPFMKEFIATLEQSRTDSKAQVQRKRHRSAKS